MNKTKPAQSIFILQKMEEENLKTAKSRVRAYYRTIPQMEIKRFRVYE